MYALIINKTITVFFFKEEEAMYNARLLEAQGNNVVIVDPVESKRVRDYTPPI